MCEFFSVGKTHPHAGVSKKRTKIPFLIGTGTNKTKKKHPLPMKKHKTTSKTPFRKVGVSLPSPDFKFQVSGFKYQFLIPNFSFLILNHRKFGKLQQQLLGAHVLKLHRSLGVVTITFDA